MLIKKAQNLKDFSRKTNLRTVRYNPKDLKAVLKHENGILSSIRQTHVQYYSQKKLLVYFFCHKKICKSTYTEWYTTRGPHIPHPSLQLHQLLYAHPRVHQNGKAVKCIED